MTDQRRGRVIVVTGGTQGVGAAIVDAFASTGNHIASIARRAVNRAGDDKRLYLQGDVTQAEQINAVAEQVIARWGRIDVWINNAGSGKLIPFVDGDDAAWDQIVQVNLWGTIHGCRAALRAMKQQGGCIINIASLAALMAPKNHSAYSVSKAAVIALTRSLAVEYAQQGVRVNAIAPGPIETEGFRAAGGDPVKRAQTIPTRKMVQPKEIARACVFLADDVPSMTGQVLVIDGGSQAAGCYVA